MLTPNDYPKYMQRCLQLAQLGAYNVAPNPMVGAVLVAPDGKIIGEGWHQQYGGAHAEVHAFADAERNQPADTYPDATLFVSLEPCSHYGKTPPCADLVIRKGVKRVVVGCLDPNPQVAGNGIHKLQAAGIEVVTGIMEKECREQNKRFISLHEKHRPYIILKWAQTADGYLGVKSERYVISNLLTKQIVHKMRAENMAIMVGTNTVVIDNPRLLTTHWSGRNPIRITLDRHNRIPTDVHIFSADAETIVYREQTDWKYILQDLAARHIHSVLVEGGTSLLQHIIQTGIYDEIHIEVAPSRLASLYPASDLVAAPTLPFAWSSASYQEIDGNRLYTLYHP